MVNKDISGAKSYDVTGKGRGSISLSIVCGSTAKRLKLSQSALEHLGNPSQVAFFKEDDSIYIQAVEMNGFAVKKMGSIYHAALIDTLTRDFKLDFSGCTCKTFQGACGTDTSTAKPYIEISFQNANQMGSSEA